MKKPVCLDDDNSKKGGAGGIEYLKVNHEAVKKAKQKYPLKTKRDIKQFPVSYKDYSAEKVLPNYEYERLALLIAEGAEYATALKSLRPQKGYSREQAFRTVLALMRGRPELKQRIFYLKSQNSEAISEAHLANARNKVLEILNKDGIEPRDTLKAAETLQRMQWGDAPRQGTRPWEKPANAVQVNINTATPGQPGCGQLPDPWTDALQIIEARREKRRKSLMLGELQPIKTVSEVIPNTTDRQTEKPIDAQVVDNT